MRKEIFRMERAAALALMARAPVVHLASTNEAGEPVLRALNAAVVRGRVCFHAAPVGEKTEAVGRQSVVAAEEVVASIPSWFLDPERACPATTLYVSALAHGAVERVDDADEKAEVLAALMAKYQPEGRHVPLAADHPLYRKAVEGVAVFAVSLEQLDGKAKLGQNRRPDERRIMLEKLWVRGLPGDPAAIERIREAAPDTPLPAFLTPPPAAAGATLVCAPGLRDVEAAADLVDGSYWNVGIPRHTHLLSHPGSAAWVGARDETGRLCATARAISDGAKRAWVFDVMVAPRWRGQGLGDAVMRLLLDHPAMRHVGRVYLSTRDAHGFYAKMGFGDRDELETRRRPFVTTQMVLLREVWDAPEPLRETAPSLSRVSIG
jgi:nitroimidazol reductase NimA-like FMN-containing flavoprotein (pyridoxamine 5'-phosphate oxidase superfamily)/N-acetylglutamate synthase-like GNAT family acetyltransferase